jgi:glycerophosphoryl diester phosphodiesterase
MQIIAHRGASGLAPENTLAAFRLAADLGAEAIETDLRLTGDGRIVLIHDRRLRRTTNGRGRVARKTFDELRRLDAGSWFPKHAWHKRRAARPFAGEFIPSLEELLDLARERDLGLYLEIKAPCSQGTEQALVAAIRNAGAQARSTVISFDAAVLQRVRQADPTLTLGYTFGWRQPVAVPRALQAGATVILPRASRTTPRLIAEAKGHGLKVISWRVNDTQRMKQLMALGGLDGIMSDFPDRLAAVVRGS